MTEQIIAKNHDALDTDNWYEIAKLIDNEFTGIRQTFTAKKRTCVILNTNVCDECSMVHCYLENGIINRIERIGPDTEGWQEVHMGTYYVIDTYLMYEGFHKTQHFNN